MARSPSYKTAFGSAIFLALFFSLPWSYGASGKKPAKPVLHIIIDPGHGGKDPGAISRKKLREKDVVLAISKRLAASLKKKLSASVLLTRDSDRFITLEERDLLANQHSCDLFLSIHANASRNLKAHGLEIYYLNKATDQASRRLAARENEGAPKKEHEIAVILSDLLQTASTEESAELAQRVKGTLEGPLQKKFTLGKIRVKTALFYVLVGAKCPSLLIETGFITNRQEGKRLNQARFQRGLAEAISNGVAGFLKSRGNPRSDL